MSEGHQDGWTQETRVRILVVDDDPPTRMVIQKAMKKADFEVWTASSGPEAIEILETRGLPHLALVDIMMPGMTGLELCRRILEFIDLPIIMVTSVNDDDTVVETIDMVAEDYIRKPFNPEELLARVRRLLRRIGDFSYVLDREIEVDDNLRVEFARRQVTVDGRTVELTPTENKLLYILMKNAGRVLQTDFLLRRMWPMEEVYEDTLRTHVYRLRRKLEAAPRRPRYVLTERGRGYCFPKLQASS